MKICMSLREHTVSSDQYELDNSIYTPVLLATPKYVLAAKHFAARCQNAQLILH